jgi:amidohydrolase
MINKRLHVIVDELTPEMEKVSRRIFENPEVGLSEYKASKWLIGILEDNGFSVELGLGSMATAFRALWKGAEPGPNIAYLAEYDALPGVGHGCGHNLVGTGSVYAAIALSKVLPAGAGTITVLGTPAEEDKGGKIILLNEGFFDDVDMVLFAHP